jgi:hypothetical protein
MTHSNTNKYFLIWLFASFVAATIMQWGWAAGHHKEIMATVTAPINDVEESMSAGLINPAFAATRK